MFREYFMGIYSMFFPRKNKRERILDLPYELDEEDTTAIKKYLDIYTREGFLSAEAFFYGRLSRERADKIEPIINSIMSISKKKSSEENTKNNYVNKSKRKSLADYVDEEIFHNSKF